MYFMMDFPVICTPSVFHKGGRGELEVSLIHTEISILPLKKIQKL